jgi:acyl-coenzyme A synthetase/AMP-(fatty) acid ligase
MSAPTVIDSSEEPTTRHVLALIHENERRFGEYVALVYEGRRFTNLELFGESRRFAAALAGLGVASGDRIVVHVPNCPEVWVTYLACCRLGAVVVPTPSSLAAEELGFILEDSAAGVVVTGSEQAEKVLGLRETAPAVEHVIVADGTVVEATGYRGLVDGIDD